MNWPVSSGAANTPFVAVAEALQRVVDGRTSTSADGVDAGGARRSAPASPRPGAGSRRAGGDIRRSGARTVMAHRSGPGRPAPPRAGRHPRIADGPGARARPRRRPVRCPARRPRSRRDGRRRSPEARSAISRRNSSFVAVGSRAADDTRPMPVRLTITGRRSDGDESIADPFTSSTDDSRTSPDPATGTSTSRRLDRRPGVRRSAGERVRGP